MECFTDLSTYESLDIHRHIQDNSKIDRSFHRPILQFLCTYPKKMDVMSAEQQPHLPLIELYEHQQM